MVTDADQLQSNSNTRKMLMLFFSVKGIFRKECLSTANTAVKQNVEEEGSDPSCRQQEDSRNTEVSAEWMLMYWSSRVQGIP